MPAVLVKNLNIPTAYLTSKERPAKDYRKYNALIIRSLSALYLHHKAQQQNQQNDAANAKDFVEYLRSIKKEKNTGLFCGITKKNLKNYLNK